MTDSEFPFWVFPLIFVSVWFLVAVLSSWLSGWFPLARRFPDREEAAAVFELKSQTGMMGAWVSLKGILHLSVCREGLRVGILRLFAPFSRDFFVPWHEITVIRRTVFFFPVVELEFGRPKVGRLLVADYVANRLAQEVAEFWPERTPPPIETKESTRKSVFRMWLLQTGFVSLLFIIVPRLADPAYTSPIPVAAALLFPAFVFGLYNLGAYYKRIKGLK